MSEVNIKSEDEIRKLFAKNLTAQLSARGKTQKDLIDFIGVSSSTASNWCTGQKLPRMDKIQAIAGWLGVTTSDLLEKKLDATIEKEAIDVADTLNRLIMYANGIQALKYNGQDLSGKDLNLVKDELEMVTRRLQILISEKKAD